VYLDVLDDLRLNKGLEVELFVTGEGAEKQIAELVPEHLQDVTKAGRRIGVEDLKRFNGSSGGSDTSFYLCGPELFAFEIDEMLKEKVGNEKVFYESWW